ncbi:insulinase family protein [Clostridium brassicae]|uniref:Insulinase family protein n=1 Tax=Clostridium brassicae TaxID=2999072 RepID=A0ABT4D8A7_9CLOT|nr:insulinase family protein [Clostridium brassicae]MCY6958544.1 insulinase family protein [Clostridium brassicae]
MKFIKKKVAFILLFALIVQCANFSLVFAASVNSDSTKYGFKLVKQTYINSIKTTVMEYIHVKSGAKLVFLKNADPNKAFSISFRTQPSDNTGVNHVLEHCILGGSKKYPVNNALMTMANQSLCSKANAGTADDHTDFYIQTSNNKDYMNLMGVICDAVFYPNFLNNRNIFLQEGGHYELDGNKSKVRYTGVVYGEVGAQNSEETLVDKSIESVLPDTIYKWNTGGNKEDIPNVTYDKVLNTYKKYYHPSNSYIYLYGNLNIDEALEYIDSNYLSKFTSKKFDIKVNLQKPFEKSVEKTYYYTIDGTPDKNSTYFSQSYVIDKATNTEVVNALEVISDILIPKLNKSAADKGLSLGNCGLLKEFAQPIFYISCNQTDESQKKVFQKIINDTLKDIVTNGIDKEVIKSLMMTYETQKSDDNLDPNLGTKSIRRNIMFSWINGGDPKAYLDGDRLINVLKKEQDERYLENIIQKYLIDNNHKSLVTLKAKQNDSVRNNGVIDVNTLSKSQLDKIISDTNELKKWQKEASSEKAISTLPLLDVSDIKLDKPAINISSLNGAKMMYTPFETKGSAYYNLYFDTSMIKQQQIPYLDLLCSILTNGSNNIYDKFKKTSGVNNATYGNIDFSADAYGRFDSTSKYSPKIKASVIAPDDNIDKSLELLKEIITNFDFKNKDEIKGFINESKSSAKNYIIYYRFPGYFSEKNRYIENLKGLRCYYFLSDIHSNFDSKWSEIQKNLIDVYNTVFNKNNITVGFIGTNDSYARFKKYLPDFLRYGKSIKFEPINYTFKDTTRNEAFITNSPNINAVIKGYNFKKLGYSYSGSMKVLEAILNNYLFEKSRTNGGYGGNAIINQDGNIYFDIARMPDIPKSLEIFDNLTSYLKNFKANNYELMKYKIGAIKKITGSNSQVVNAMENQEQMIMGKTQKDYEKELNEILGTTQEDINKMAKMVDDVIKQNIFLVMGNKDKINKQKKIFNRIVDISQ